MHRGAWILQRGACTASCVAAQIDATKVRRGAKSCNAACLIGEYGTKKVESQIEDATYGQCLKSESEHTHREQQIKRTKNNKESNIYTPTTISRNLKDFKKNKLIFYDCACHHICTDIILRIAV